MSANVGLAEAISALRDELTAALQQGADEDLRFGLDSVELETEAVVTREANGKLGWKIIEAGGSFESAKTQRVRLVLTPGLRGFDGRVSNDFSISGPHHEGDSFTGA
ncbi:trypco2 family protein [Mycobacterium sp. 236(2023)]|uniref:trypco2 family protein n=1 Tax=Mycobacterium sp. 236(2023) TaxID=3038163 RepID=UPI0024157CED|nr:trypco2 family protein [Mycobacterium sp. 236(2023)]MDG4667950.1 hypothetical protein [Mycobacterium sp. 236(2023)]